MRCSTDCCWPLRPSSLWKVDDTEISHNILLQNLLESESFSITSIQWHTKCSLPYIPWLLYASSGCIFYFTISVWVQTECLGEKGPFYYTHTHIYYYILSPPSSYWPSNTQPRHRLIQLVSPTNFSSMWRPLEHSNQRTCCWWASLSSRRSCQTFRTNSLWRHRQMHSPLTERFSWHVWNGV